MKQGLVLYGALLVSLSASLLMADDWPQWRGPKRNGTSTETINTHWTADGPKLLWSALVGTGFSGISVSRDRAYTLGNTTNQDTIWCLDARTGTQIWTHSYPAQLSPQWYEGGPGATPTVDHDRVFTISKWGDVFCLDATKGTIIWQRHLQQDQFKPNRWGFAGSPLLWQNLVVLNVGDAGAALDRFTGRIVWSNGTNAAGYASPVLFRSGSRESILIFGARALLALDPRTGKELWRYPWKTDWDTNNTDPLVYRNGIFLSSFSHGCALLSIKGKQPELDYESKALYNHLSPGLILGEYLYAFNGEAKKETDLRCLHLPTGEVRWTRKEPAFGSLIAARGVLIALSEKGELVLFKSQTHAGIPVPDAEPLASARLSSGTCWTPASLANGLLYVRNAKGELRCFDLRPNVLP